MDNLVVEQFFALDAARRDLFLSVYRGLFGEKAAAWVLSALARWRQHPEHVPGLIAFRLICVLPKFLKEDEATALLNGWRNTHHPLPVPYGIHDPRRDLLWRISGRRQRYVTEILRAVDQRRLCQFHEPQETVMKGTRLPESL